MSRMLVSSLIFALALAAGGRAQQATSIADLKTTAEASGFKSTSTYDDVVRFMKAVDAASPLIHYATYGKTYEGRDMPMAIVGAGLKDVSPAAVRATNRLRVHIQGNIHAGEVEGKESAQILLREFAMGQHADWLKTMVFIITPIFNADGNEKFALTNRQRQNGPINGMGTRQQGQNLNINRDFMKLDTPEGRAFVKLWNDYDPHVGYDLHTSDGSAHGYYLTYSPPLNPNTSPLIMNLMKDEWFPFVTKAVKAKHGWDMFYYGNASMPGGRGRGRGGDPAAGLAGTRRRRAGRTGWRRPDDAAPDHAAPAAHAHDGRVRAAADRAARVVDVRARAPLPQQLRGLAEPLRAPERGLRVRDVRGPHQGDELLHGRVAELRASARGSAEEDRGRCGQGSRSSARWAPRGRR